MVTCCRVTAYLRHGLVRSDPWSPALDAILAYWQLVDELGWDEFALGCAGLTPFRPCETLPVERETAPDGDWWWRCSAPLVPGEAPVVAPRYFHRRYNTLEAESYTDQRRVQVNGGPFKNYRIREIVSLYASLTWHIAGDAEGIRRLLRRCTAIGDGRSRGNGEVLRWEVTEDGNPALARYLRPVPKAWAEAQELEGAWIETRWGIRPPGYAPEHQRDCVLPRPEVLTAR